MPSLSDDRRGSSTERGYGAAWQSYRARYLVDHPFCVMCEVLGLLRVATVVDHKKPHRLGAAIKSGVESAISAARKLFWDPANHQSLCETCHNAYKQRFEKSGTTVGCTADGIPIDPKHHWAGAR